MQDNRKVGISEASLVVIPVSISGEDVQGLRFTEITSTVEVNKKGGKLLTRHELRPGATLEIRNLETNRTSKGRVTWMGNLSGTRREIAVEIEDGAPLAEEVAENVQAPETPPVASQAPAPPPPSSSMPMTENRSSAASLTETAKPEPSAGRAGTGLSEKPSEAAAAAVRAPADVQRGETLPARPQAVLEVNLRSAAEQLKKELGEYVAQAQSTAVAKIQGQIQSAVATLDAHLKKIETEIAVRQERALERTIEGFANMAEQATRQRREEFNKNMEDTLHSGQARVQQEAARWVSEAGGNIRQQIEQELSQFENQVAQQCQARVERLLSARMQEAESRFPSKAQPPEGDWTERLAEQGNEVTARVASALEQQSVQILATLNARAEQRLEAAGNLLATRVRESEQDQKDRLEWQAQQISGRFSAELERRCAQALVDTGNRLQQRLEEVEKGVSHHVRQAEEEFAKLLGRRGEDLAGRLSAELEGRFDQALNDSGIRLSPQLEETASRVRQSFMRHVIAELNQRQELMFQEARRSVQEITDQSLGRLRAEIARLVKELGEAMVNQAGSLS